MTIIDDRHMRSAIQAEGERAIARNIDLWTPGGEQYVKDRAICLARRVRRDRAARKRQRLNKATKR